MINQAVDWGSQPHSFYTQRYNGHYIHSHCQGGRTFVRWQFVRPGMEPIISNARSVKAAKAAITKMIRSYNGKDQPI